MSSTWNIVTVYHGNPVVCLLLLRNASDVWLNCMMFLHFLKTRCDSLCVSGIWKISLYRQVTWYDYRWKGGELFAVDSVDLVKIDISVRRITLLQWSYAEKHYSLASPSPFFRHQIKDLCVTNILHGSHKQKKKL